MSNRTHERSPAVMGVTSPAAPSTLPSPVRNAYWHGKTMGVDEFVRDQEYHRTIQQTLTRLTVGCGVLCGLSVSRHGDAGAAISAGAAVDGAGRLVVVDQAVALDDLGRWICDPSTEQQLTPPGEYVLCLLHHECPVHPAPVLVTDCDTRVECRPGAIAERYRFEARRVERPHCGDPCPACGGRSSGRGRCRCAEGIRSCGSACDDCVPVAWFRWDGSTVVDLTMEGRTGLPSIRDLARRADPVDDVIGPRLVGMWPHPGQVLDRVGAPSEWGRWRYRPRLEFCFDQPVDWDRVDDAADWLRAWIVVPGDDPPAAGSPPTVRRVALRALPGATTTNGDGQTLAYVFDTDASIDAIDRVAVHRGFVVVVQARASSDTGPAGAGAVSQPAQIEFAGTRLSPEQLDRLWASNELPPEAWPEGLTNPTAPTCFGDGYDGGRLHAAFWIAPVGDAQAATGVAPHNGARVRSERLPALEISSTAPLDGLQPRAWLVGLDGAVTTLTMGGAQPLAPGTAPGARDRYRSSFDTTLDAEIAHTVTFAIDGAGLPSRGRVLVVLPSHARTGDVGSFAGTCLTEAEAAHIYEHGLSTEHLDHVRPSSARMPRASSAGAWVHWTFAWEQNHVSIR